MKRKSIILLSILLMECSSLYAQKSEWVWFKCFGGKGADEIKSTDVDNKGNIFIGGFFQNEIKFGKYKLEARGEYDAFIAKLKPSGKVLWAKNFGGDYSEQQTITEFVKKLVVDSRGNVIIAGEFYFSAYFGNQLVKSNGNMDVFLAKLNTDGELLWVHSLGGKYHNNFYDMTIDKEDNIYISYTNFEDDGYRSYNSYTVLSSFNNNGDLLWLKNLQNHNNVFLNTIDNSLSYITATGKPYDTLNNKGLLICYYDRNGNETDKYFFQTTSTYILTSASSANDSSLLFTGKLLLLKDEKYKLPERSELVYFGMFSTDGSCKWMIDPPFTTSSGKQNMIQVKDDEFLVTNTFTKSVSILDKDLYPMGLWHNSYVFSCDGRGKLLRLVASMEGMIETVSMTDKNEIVISGSFLSPNQLKGFIPNKEKGFMDIFIGKKLINDE